jgi:predicted negative regulator of RcsB-dependent stress response
MLRYLSISLLLLCLSSPGRAQLDSLLTVLDQELELRGEYLAQRISELEAFDRQREVATSSEEEFAITLKKIAALESFSFNRANEEVIRLKELAQKVGDPEKIALARIREAFILVSAGLFNEALDSLNTIHPASLTTALKVEYFATIGRVEADLSDSYTSPHLSGRFRKMSISHIDSALAYCQDPFKTLELESNRAIGIPDPIAGIKLYHQIRISPQASTRLMAKEHGAAGRQYSRMGMRDSAQIAYLQSAIADERTVTREITSLVRVARDAYEKGDFERSANYINIGLENANFFGARHRKIEVLEILPLIEEERRQLLNSQRRQFIIFTSLLSLLLILALVLIRRTIQQNRELSERRQALQEAYQQLATNNASLRESQKIKEQYIGYFFQTNTKLITTAKGIIDKAAKAVYAADFKEAKFQLKSFNAKKQNLQLLKDFDKAFLTLFPNFVEKFQALFPENIIWQENGQEDLSTEVRIFALMRLGIRNNDIIAKILGYSVNTVYAYRSKVRGKSPMENDAFDAAVMEISSNSKANLTMKNAATRVG